MHLRAFLAVLTVSCVASLVGCADSQTRGRPMLGAQPESLAAMRAQMAPDATFTIGNTSASEYPLAEITGLVPPPDLLERMMRHNAELEAADREIRAEAALPSRFDWTERGGVSPVRDQGRCGSCWAFGTAGVVESLHMRNGTGNTDLSEQILINCTNGSCAGGWWVFDYLQSPGIVRESDVPYRAADRACENGNWRRYRIASWGYVNPNSAMPTVEQLKSAIHSRGPLTVAVYADTFFQRYTGGVFNQCTNATVNHAVLLVGWDDARRAFKFKNSWGTGWGESGYGWIRYGCNNIGYGAAWAR